MKIRELDVRDIDRLVVLNDAAYPAVPTTSAEEMRELLAVSDFTVALVQYERVVGFVIGMRPGSTYSSENYRYFAGRGTNCLYVDRIVVDEERRGEGLGRRLYSAIFDLAHTENRVEVCCEVNIRPPNPESLAFHARLGFVKLGEQSTKNGSVTVALLAAAVS